MSSQFPDFPLPPTLQAAIPYFQINGGYPSRSPRRYRAIKRGLHVEQQANRDFFVQKRVEDLLLLPLLIGDQEGLARFVRHQDRAGIGLLKPLGLDLAQVDQGEGQAVCQEGAKLLHQVEGEAGPAGAVAMEEAHGRVEAHRLQGRADVVDQEGVDEGEQGIDVVPEAAGGSAPRR